VQGAGQFGPAPQALTQALMQGVRQFGTGPQALTQTLTQGVGQFGPKDIAQALVQGAEQLGPQNLARTLMQGTGQFGSNPQALTQGLMQGTSGFNPIGLVAAAFGGAQALADPKASQALTQALMRGTGGFNPQGLAAAAFGGIQTLTDPKTRQTLAQQLMQGAQGFGNTASGWGMSALNTLRQVNDPATVQRALAFYDTQVSQGQQQGGVGGFFQQALGHTGGTVINLGQGAINTVRNWDTMTYAREAQTFYSGQVAAGQKEGGVTGFFQQGMGYVGGGLASLPGLATQISSGIDRAIDWAGQNRQWLYGAVNNQVKDVPILKDLMPKVFGVTELSAQFTSGVGKGAGAMVGGIAQMVTNPVDTLKGLYTMAEHIPTFGGMGTGPNPLKLLSATGDVLFNGADPKQRFASALDFRQSAQQDANFWGNALGSFWQPYQESINAGRPMEAVGRGVFEVVSNVLGGGSGVAGKAGKVSQVANLTGDLSQAGRLANVTGDLSQASRLGRTAGMMDNLGGLGGMLQRGRGALGGMFDNAGGLLQRGRGAIGGMFDDAGGLLRRGQQAAGGVFDNIVGLPQRFRQWGGNTFQRALQRGRGVFADLKGLGRDLMDEFGPQPSLRRMLGDDLAGRGFGLGDLWKDVKGIGGDIRDWLSGKPRQPDLVTPEGVRIPASQLDDVPPANTMAMSNTPDVPGGKPEKRRNYLGSNDGHTSARQVLDGGRPDALGGDGAYYPRIDPPTATIPEGTTLTRWTEHNKTLESTIGLLVETGDYDTIARIFNEYHLSPNGSTRYQEMLTGAQSFLPGAEVPNYVHLPPSPKVSIRANTTSTAKPTPLSEILEPNMGHIDWAVCTEIPPGY
jgi:hypothetical protein